MNHLCINWLNKEAKKLINKHWNLELIPRIVIDETPFEKWASLENDYEVLAKYWNKTKTIEFNTKRNENESKSDVRNTLLHELCHWYLHLQGLPHRDSDKRFALELIRVGVAKTCNFDNDAQRAMKEAKKHKRTEYFEINNYDHDFMLRLRHPRKNGNDFQEDLKNTLIRIYEDKQVEIKNYGEYGEFTIDDVANMLCNWYGYKYIDENCATVVSLDAVFDDMTNRDTMICNLEALGCSNGDEILSEEADYKENVLV